MNILNSVLGEIILISLIPISVVVLDYIILKGKIFNILFNYTKDYGIKTISVVVIVLVVFETLNNSDAGLIIPCISTIIGILIMAKFIFPNKGKSVNPYN